MWRQPRGQLKTSAGPENSPAEPWPHRRPASQVSETSSQDQQEPSAPHEATCLLAEGEPRREHAVSCRRLCPAGAGRVEASWGVPATSVPAPDRACDLGPGASWRGPFRACQALRTGRLLTPRSDCELQSAAGGTEARRGAAEPRAPSPCVSPCSPHWPPPRLRAPGGRGRDSPSPGPRVAGP